jgi:hypothetical protein
MKKAGLLLAALLLSTPLSGCMNLVIADTAKIALEKCGALSRFRAEGGDLTKSSSFDFNCREGASHVYLP